MKNLAIACATPIPVLLALTCAALIALPDKPPVSGASIRFTDVTKESGLNFQQSYGDHHLDNIVEGTGTGVCVFDYNNDGFLDVYFPNGKWTEGLSDEGSRDLRGKLTNHLFRNNGDGTFTDVTVEAGLGGSRYSVGCAAADYDNDGNVDLLVLNYGKNELFHNAACPGNNGSVNALQTWTGSGSNAYYALGNYGLVYKCNSITWNGH